MASDYLSIQPQELRIPFLPRRELTARMSMTNLLNETIFVKVITTGTNLFTISPSKFFIAASDSAIITLRTEPRADRPHLKELIKVDYVRSPPLGMEGEDWVRLGMDKRRIVVKVVFDHNDEAALPAQPRSLSYNGGGSSSIFRPHQSDEAPVEHASEVNSERIEQLAGELEEARERLEDNAKIVRDLMDAKKKTDSEKKQLEAELAALSSKVESSVSKQELKKLIDEKNEMESLCSEAVKQNTRLQEELANAKRSLAASESMASQDRGRALDAERELAARLSSSPVRSASLESEKAELAAALAQEKHDNDELRLQTRQAVEEFDRLEDEINKVELECRNSKAARDHALQQVQQLQTELEEQRYDLGRLRLDSSADQAGDSNEEATSLRLELEVSQEQQRMQDEQLKLADAEIRRLEYELDQSNRRAEQQAVATFSPGTWEAQGGNDDADDIEELKKVVREQAAAMVAMEEEAAKVRKELQVAQKQREEEVARLQAELRAVSENLAALEVERGETSSRALDDQQELDELKQQHAELVARAQALDESLMRSEENAASNEQLVEALQRKLARQQQQNADFEAEAQRQAGLKVLAMSAEVAQVREQSRVLQQEMERMEANRASQVAALQEKLRSLQTNVSSAPPQRKAPPPPAENNREEVERLAAKVAVLQTECKQHLAKIAALDSELAHSQAGAAAQVYGFASQLASVQEEVATLKKALENEQHKFIAMQTKLENSLEKTEARAAKQERSLMEKHHLSQAKHTESMETLTNLIQSLENQAEQAVMERSNLEVVIGQLEVYDLRKRGHILGIRPEANFRCVVCKQQGNGWVWRCKMNGCSDCLHLSCLVSKK